MPTATFEIVRTSRDARGAVFEPAQESELMLQRNVHVAVTQPGAIRGNHVHEHATEIAVIIGPALVRLREDGVIRDVHIPADEVYRFILPPLVSHAFQNTGSEPMVLVAFSTAPFDAKNPDVIRDALIK